MNQNPFNGGTFGAMGAQMAQAWQQGLETWWKTVLGDPARLSELASSLGQAGFGVGPGGASADDLARVLEAIELIEGRLGRLEDRVADLASSLDGVVEILEAAGSDS